MGRRILAILLVLALVAGCGRHRGARSAEGASGGLHAVVVPDGAEPCPSRCSESYYADHASGHEARYAYCLSRCEGAAVVEDLECAAIEKPAKALCVTHFDARGAPSTDGPRMWPWVLGIAGGGLFILLISTCKGSCLTTGG